MKVGDVVMYIADDRYAEWFFGRLGVVIKMSTPKQIAQRRASRFANWDGATIPDERVPVRGGACRVKWLEPVPYFGRTATISDFALASFECIKR